MKKIYNIEVDCANCANLCEVEVNKVKGVALAVVNFMMQKMTIEFEDGVDENKTMKTVLKICKKIEPDFSIEL